MVIPPPQGLEQENDLSKFKTDDMFPEFTGWEAVGFHRPLAAELWGVALELVNETFAIFVVAYLIPFLNPYAEIGGYTSLANGLFLTIYVIFDTGTNFGLGRFISEYRIKDPKKMMEYVGFYVKYQMITGLIQVTLLSYYLFEVVVNGNYGYLFWIILLEMQKQYPGMVGIFKSVLDGMQHYSAVKIMNWVQGKGIELLVNFGFILWGEKLWNISP